MQNRTEKDQHLYDAHFRGDEKKYLTEEKKQDRKKETLTLNNHLQNSYKVNLIKRKLMFSFVCRQPKTWTGQITKKNIFDKIMLFEMNKRTYIE